MYKQGLVELEVVLAVADKQNFRAAAVELNMSTTGVSNALRGLEARLGERLFHRTTRSVSLTEAGRRFVEQIRPAVANINAAMMMLQERKPVPTGTLRINSSLGAALMVFHPLMRQFLARYPGMTLEISTQEKLVDIVADGFDAGVRLSSRVPGDMIRVPITDSIAIAVVASPEYFSTYPKPHRLEDLKALPCIRARYPSGIASPWEFWADDKAVMIDVQGPLILDAPLMMLEAARSGLGLAQVPRWYVEGDIREGRLIEVLQSWAKPLPGLSLYYAGHRHIPVGLRALIDLIQEQRRVSL
ncbi:DNA-binding transcriptional regulator, LysR family [Pseudomonas sp. NFACC02]|uniref:LysR family transcriptional regulator n=1 Tax=Pseudomonas sp. NFACC02 TaxID=1566250 RepID=UPI0008D247A7|nr:LysR family transcriptional regulator [Pseudomonas sp. NFACC02]SER72725.1 DNA-binding transcriptional regulator, LysR family [Pseudomonas sp. NFACC02]